MPKPTTTGLARWHKEKWTKPDGKPCGTSKDKQNPEKCRPSVRVTSGTPKTWSELSSKEKKSAIRDKQKANRANRQFGKLRLALNRK